MLVRFDKCANKIDMFQVSIIEMIQLKYTDEINSTTTTTTT